MRFSLELDERLMAVLAVMAGLLLLVYTGGDVRQAEMMLVGLLAGRGLRSGDRT